MRVGGVLESQIAVDSDKLVHWRWIQVEDHTPSRFDVDVFAFLWHFACRPVVGNVPVSDSVLLGHIFVDFFAALTDTSMASQSNMLLFISVVGLVFGRKD